MADSGIFKELAFFALAMLRGILLLVIYDLIRIFRRLLPHGAVAVAFEDAAYWLLSAFLVFQLLYRENDGVVRGYALLAVALGMLIYHRTISRPVVKYVSGILKLVLGTVFKPAIAARRKVVQVRRQVGRHYKKKLKNRLKEFIIILFS